MDQILDEIAAAARGNPFTAANGGGLTHSSWHDSHASWSQYSSTSQGSKAVCPSGSCPVQY